MPSMPRSLAVAVAVAFALLAGCSPALNWREVRVEPSSLKALMPCKPDERAHDVPLGSRTLSLHVIGCEAGGATFAILWGDVGDAAAAAGVLAQWRAANIAQLRGHVVREAVFQPPGARTLEQSKLVVATGQNPQGARLDNQAAYFAKGTTKFQAVIFGERNKQEAADTFFPGLHFE